MIRLNWLGIPPAIELHPGAVDPGRQFSRQISYHSGEFDALSGTVNSIDACDTVVKVIL